MGYLNAVCRRGHFVDHNVVDATNRIALGGSDWDFERTGYEVDRFCRQCGASVITACPQCGAGMPFDGVVGFVEPDPFCTSCGSPLPWANRDARIGQLKNLLDDEPLDEATRLVVQEAIDALGTPVVEESQTDVDGQVEAAEQLRRLAPGMWEFAKPVLQSLLTAAAKARLGL